jgi:hypothetical protein
MRYTFAHTPLHSELKNCKLITVLYKLPDYDYNYFSLLPVRSLCVYILA